MPRECLGIDVGQLKVKSRATIIAGLADCRDCPSQFDRVCRLVLPELARTGYKLLAKDEFDLRQQLRKRLKMTTCDQQGKITGGCKKWLP